MEVDYTGISKTYDKYRSYPNELIRQVIESANIEKDKRILDLGCGTGNLSVQLSGLINADPIGIDRSIPMLEKARKKMLRVLCADVDHCPLPLHNDSFDVVVGAYVIHHIKNQMALFRECYRILRAGTFILLTSSHDQLEHLSPVINECFPSLIEIDKQRFPDIPKIDYFFKMAGFRDIKYEELILSEIPIDRRYLEKVKNKFISTFYLLSENEFRSGVKKLEAFIDNNEGPAFREWQGTMVCGRK